MRLADYFDKAAEEHPERLTLIAGEREVRFDEAQRTVHSIAHALDGEGASVAHVALYAPNHYLVPLILLGINRSDRCWVSAHVRNSVEVNIEVLSFMDCDLMFFHSSFESIVPTLRAGLPRIKKFVCIDRESEFGPSLQAWTDPHQRPYPSSVANPNAAALIQPTGGTTGPSKAVVHSHYSVEMSLVARRELSKFSNSSRFLAVAPLTHAAGLVALSVMCCGGCTVIQSGTNAAALLELVERFRITNLFMPPTLLYNVLDEMRERPRDTSSVVRIMTGAAPVAPDRIKEGTKLFGPVLCEAYGLTECGAPLIFKAPEDYILADGSFDEVALASAGRVIPFARAKIVDEKGDELPRGERGEIVIIAGTVMTEYYKNPEATREADLNGWRRTGDVGVMDDRGFVTIVDRLRDMIVSGGFNVYSTPIEAVIMEHPAVFDCAVIGVPDKKWGEAVKAIVQLREGGRVDEEAIIALCRDRLGPVYSPKSVEFWPDLPKSPVGKTLKREIRAKFWTDNWRAV